MIEPRMAGSLIEALRAEQRQRWRQGEPVLAEAYIERHRVLQDDEEVALGLVYHEVLLREERGETPLLEEYQKRFPHLASRLRALFEVHSVFTSTHFLNAEGAASTSSLPHRAAAPAGEALSTVAGYELLGELGSGGMGVVYLARDARLNRQVALKMVRVGAFAGAQELERVSVEARAVARLEHPNIVRIYEVGEHDGLPFLALEYVEGGSLDSKLGGKPLGPRHAAELVRTLARAVDHAHRRGIIHRDLKPGNVLLSVGRDSVAAVEDRHGVAGYIPKITDFGLAKQLDAKAGQTRTGAVLGTPSYMAPEQARGQSKEVGPAADVWALGAILYECLTGRPPFLGRSVLETLEQVCGQDPVPPRLLQPRVPADLETVCLKCLHKEPADRYPTAEALADDLARHLDGEPIHARGVNLLEQVTRLLNRHERSSPVADVLAGWHIGLAPVPFLLQLILFLFAGDRTFYPLTAVLLTLLTPALLIAILRRVYRAPHGALSPAATRQLWSSRVGHFGGMLVLVLVSYLITPAGTAWNPLTVFPLWIVVAGVTFFNLGGQFWGRFYLVGLGLFVGAGLACLRLEWAPLAVGLLMSAVVTVLGLHLRRISRLDGDGRV